MQVHIKHMNRLSLVWSPLTSTRVILYYGQMTFDLHPLLQECSWGIKQDLGIFNMQHWRFSSVWSYICVSWCLSYSTLFQGDLLPPPLELVLHSHKCIMFLSALGNIMHLCEWGTSSEGGAISYHVEYITPSFLTFFQFGEKTQWIMDGFALGRICTRCVDIDHSCTKAPWV